MVKNLEMKMREYFEVQEEKYSFEIAKVEGIITVKCFDNDGISNELKFEISSAAVTEDINILITDLIDCVYQKYINPSNKRIRAFAEFCNRKINSLDKALQKGDTDKISKINLDLTEKYRITKSYKNDVSFYKTFVKMFYCIKGD